MGLYERRAILEDLLALKGRAGFGHKASRVPGRGLIYHPA
jgi:hypothetical protein